MAIPVLVRSLASFNNDTIIPVGPSADIPYHMNNLQVQFLVPHQEGIRMVS